MTTPQATLLAASISGPALILAAYIAFHGQRENRAEEARKFEIQMAEQRAQADALLTAQRNQLTEQLDAQRQQLLSEQAEARHAARRATLEPIYRAAATRYAAILTELGDAKRLVTWKELGYGHDQKLQSHISRIRELLRESHTTFFLHASPDTSDAAASFIIEAAGALDQLKAVSDAREDPKAIRAVVDAVEETAGKYRDMMAELQVDLC
jgi:hypothetical protein